MSDAVFSKMKSPRYITLLAHFRKLLGNELILQELLVVPHPTRTPRGSALHNKCTQCEHSDKAATDDASCGHGYSLFLVSLLSWRGALGTLCLDRVLGIMRVG